MALAQRLQRIEQRLSALEEWAAEVQQALEAEEAAQDGDAQRTLDGEDMGVERDQSQDLG